MSNLILETLALNPTPRRPVWIMRQAGRYLADFRKLREKHSFEEVNNTLELAVQVTLMPIKKYPLDAAIIFSDILFPLKALGAGLAFTEKGPKLDAPKSVEDLKKLRTSFNPQESTSAILKTISAVRKELPKEKAVFGFAGAPFTMLAYLLEGDLTRELKVMKRWMAEHPKVVHEWLQNLALVTGDYLDAQANAGADAVQLFDTWAGVLSPEDYETFALPYARQALSAVTVPSIYYVNGVAGILQQVSSVGAQCLSIDWKISLGEARKKLSHVTALQGNLDPYSLLLPNHLIREKVFAMCESYGRGAGHIVNLGHGIVPEIPEDAVKVFIDSVREWSEGL
ncbi:MAG: uroporphyrinogen decarboxylase [Deltaproteobacteria bacterium]|nr:uroporphyrinogen decarboxylase [Deltaproteobacteria bacterium]